MPSAGWSRCGCRAPTALGGSTSRRCRRWSRVAADQGSGSPPAPSYEHGVERTRRGLTQRLRGLLRGQVDDETWEEVEETLIGADIGAELAMRVVQRARGRRDVADAEAAVIAELSALFAPRDPT